jgi:predicted amidophosphoribosyltransferase
MKICPECNNQVVEDTKVFCYLDGTKLKPAPTCECGNLLSTLDKYCEMCGKKVEPVQS